jgi:predicted transport protein
MADQLLEVIQRFDPGFEFKHNKFYIGLGKNERPNNFASFRPQKSGLRLEVRLPRSGDIEQKLAECWIGLNGIQHEMGKVSNPLNERRHSQTLRLLAELLKNAYQRTSAD